MVIEIITQTKDMCYWSWKMETKDNYELRFKRNEVTWNFLVNRSGLPGQSL